MTARTLLADLRRRGVTLAAVDGRLRFHPREAVTPADISRLRDLKDDLLELLTPRLLCLWCHSADLREGAGGRLWCTACHQPAWLPTSTGGLMRADQNAADELWSQRRRRPLVGADYPRLPSSAPDAAMLATRRPCSTCRVTLATVGGLCGDCFLTGNVSSDHR